MTDDEIKNSLLARSAAVGVRFHPKQLDRGVKIEREILAASGEVDDGGEVRDLWQAQAAPDQPIPKELEPES